MDFMAVNAVPAHAKFSVLHDLASYYWTYENLLWGKSFKHRNA